MMPATPVLANIPNADSYLPATLPKARHHRSIFYDAASDVMVAPYARCVPPVPSPGPVRGLGCGNSIPCRIDAAGDTKTGTALAQPTNYVQEGTGYARQ